MKVLFIRFSAIGDVTLTTGPIDYFHRKFPNAQIDVLTSEVGKVIFEQLGFIKRIHILPKASSIRQLIQIYKAMPDYDYIFDLQSNLKSYALKPFVSGKISRVQKQSSQRRAFVKKRQFKSELNKHVVTKYAETCLKPFQLEAPSLEKLRPRLPALKSSPPPEIDDIGNFVVLHPYASQKNKEWPGFLELANLMIINGIQVVIIGNGDKNWPREVINLSNKTSMHQLCSVISQSTALVTTDSGPMHIGVALQKPLIALFGPTTKHFGFYPEFRRCIVIEDEDLDCRPCHVHGGNECPLKHFQCMKGITAKEVFTKLHNLIIETKI